MYPHETLIEQCKKGDRRAQLKIYELYHRAMYNLSFQLLACGEEAEEVMHDAFLSAFQNISQCEKNSSFGAWLKKITINKALDMVKKRKKEVESFLVEPTAETEECVEEKENFYVYEARRIKQIIKNLPINYRSVAVLFLLEGYTHSEIASILNISEKVSRIRLFRAKKNILKDLKNSKL